MIEMLLGRPERTIDPQKLILRYLAASSIGEANEGLSESEQIPEKLYKEILRKWGIVEYVGPDRQYPEILYLLSEMATRKISLGSVFVRRPLIFGVSVDSFEEVVKNIQRGIILRTGTALVLSPEGEPHSIVVGNDYSDPRGELGKNVGSLTVPECFSKLKEDQRISILRVFQREVFANLSAEGSFNLGMVSVEEAPIAYVDVADVRVTCYRGTIPKRLMGELSSPTIFDLKTRQLDEVLSLKRVGTIRAGLPETIREYQRFLISGPDFEPRVVTSELNGEISKISTEMVPSWKLA